MFEPVEDFELGEGVEEGVGVGGGERGEKGAEVCGMVHQELFVHDERFCCVRACDGDCYNLFVEVPEVTC